MATIQAQIIGDRLKLDSHVKQRSFPQTSLLYAAISATASIANLLTLMCRVLVFGGTRNYGEVTKDIFEWLGKMPEWPFRLLP